MADQTIRFNIKIPVELHRRFKAAAALRGETQTEAVLRMMNDYITQTDADTDQSQK